MMAVVDNTGKDKLINQMELSIKIMIKVKILFVNILV